MDTLHAEKQQARQLLANRKFSEAEKLLELLLSQHADEGELWRLCGRARYSRRNFWSSSTALEHASMLVPLSAKDQCMLADCYAKTGRSQHAANLYRLLAEDPACPAETLPTIAAGLGQLGEFRAAMETCQRASQQDPSRVEPQFGMAYYLCRLGYPPKVTIPLFRRIVDLAPHCSLYRSTLAFLLAADGNMEEAYDFLRDVPPAEAGCSCQLRRMMAIFQAVGDSARWSQCKAHLDSRAH
jgi:tetratricopeptide (TPR) repeat protein